VSGSTDHPDWNALAALADCGPDGAPPGLLEHLGSCAQCHAAWSAAVEQRHHDLAAVAPRDRRLAGRNRSRRELWGGLGGVAAAALLLFVLLPGRDARQESGSAETAVLLRLGEMSQVGLVYPRVDRFGDAPRTEYRTGQRPGPDTDLSPWTERYRSQPGDTTAAFWLAAGCLSLGRVDQAEDVIRRALALSPQANELRHLAVIAAYRRNDLALASRHLEVLLHEYPDDPLAALNRAALAIESGRPAGVCEALERVARHTARPALRQRALQLAHKAGCGPQGEPIDQGPAAASDGRDNGRNRR